LAARVGARVSESADDLLARDDVNAVVIATPPHTHAPLTLAALAARRHVFCEKPAATDVSSADAVRLAVHRSGCIYVVDHVLRFNPVLCALTRLHDCGLLGPVQRFAFDNDASDEDLPSDHWFWDETVSGGIFVEHGVHFFDAAQLVTGRPATHVQAVGTTRADGVMDTVACTVTHAGGALAGHAHGFSHPHRAERQLMRVDYGLAEARVHGWIPLRADIDVWTDRATEFEKLPARRAELLHVAGYRLDQAARVEVDIQRDAARARLRTRGVVHDAPHHVRLTIDLGWPEAKAHVYRESVRAALADFSSCIRTGDAPRAGIDQGRDAVAVAVAARAAVRDGRTHRVESRPAVPTQEVPCSAPV
jgi:predicted dehydrogenase